MTAVRWSLPRRSSWRRSLCVGLGLSTAAVGVALLAFLLRQGPTIIAHGPGDRPWVALTFDADMTPSMLARLRSGEVPRWYDPEIVSELRTTRTPATIFLTGLWAMTYPDIVKSLAVDPLFELENHSVDHAAFQRPCFNLPTVASETQKRWQVEGASAAITAIAGVKPRYFRFPGGCHAEADLRLVASLGHQPVGWDVSSGDAFQPDPEVIVRLVLEQVRPGSIVAMHLIGAPHAPATASALRILIPALRSRGLRFVTLHQLLVPGAAPS